MVLDNPKAALDAQGPCVAVVARDPDEAFERAVGLHELALRQQARRSDVCQQRVSDASTTWQRRGSNAATT